MDKDGSLLKTVLSDAAWVNVATILAFLIRFGGRIPASNFQAYLKIIPWITLIRILTFYFAGLYEREDEEDGFHVFYSVFIAVTLGSIAIIALSFYLRTLPFPRTVFPISWTFNILLISTWHVYLFYQRQKRLPPKRFLVLGGSPKGQEIVQEIRSQPFPRSKVVGLLSGYDEREGGFNSSKLRRSIRGKKASDVVIADPDVSYHKILDMVFAAEAEDVTVWLVPGLYQVILGKVELAHLGDIPLVRLRSEPLKEREKVIKRLVDLIFSILVLIFSAPLMLLFPLIIKLESKGPIFYRQKRVGLKEKIYEVYKFRSMLENAEAETGPILARQNDKRVTRVGSFLRRSHLDELPQFLNVLKGEMSLVGPRPERPAFIKEFNREIRGYSRRFTVKPGITGPAQLYGRYETSAKNKLKYDLAYINNWSLGLDLKILFLSLEIILRGRM